jgi:hypothetical protein
MPVFERLFNGLAARCRLKNLFAGGGTPAPPRACLVARLGRHWATKPPQRRVKTGENGHGLVDIAEPQDSSVATSRVCGCSIPLIERHQSGNFDSSEAHFMSR